jgi:hypothetical protein
MIQAFERRIRVDDVGGRLEVSRAQRVERRMLADLNGHPRDCAQIGEIGGVREVTEVDFGRGERIGGAEPHLARALGVHQTSAYGEGRLVVDIRDPPDHRDPGAVGVSGPRDVRAEL